jgi:hypothetical protein
VVILFLDESESTVCKVRYLDKKAQWTGYHIAKVARHTKKHIAQKKNFIRPTMALHHPGGRRLRRRR